MSDNYPIGARYDMNAPYNEALDHEVEVCISVTLNRTVPIQISDRDIEDEDYNIPTHILKEAVVNNGLLPKEVYTGEWEIDDLEVIQE